MLVETEIEYLELILDNKIISNKHVKVTMISSAKAITVCRNLREKNVDLGQIF